MPEDNWTDRATGMVCASCVFYVPKKGTRCLGRCRRHAPTMSGFPVVFPTDWCGDHKLHEDDVEKRLDPLDRQEGAAEYDPYEDAASDKAAIHAALGATNLP